LPSLSAVAPAARTTTIYQTVTETIYRTVTDRTYTYTETIYETVTVTVYTTFTYTPEDVRIVTRYYYVFIFLLVLAPVAVWKLGKGSGREKSTGTAQQPLRLCPKCGRNLTSFPSRIKACPFCGGELK
jgi:hypothetical protein